ncbi:MAG: helix-turn-helix domain-containing protein [Cyanobacteria bacterium P01_H01_bin.58]
MKTPSFSNSKLSSASEYGLILGAGASAAVSLVTQQVAAASLPMTVLVAMGLMNRRRLDERLKVLDPASPPPEATQHQATVDTPAKPITAQPQPETLTPVAHLGKRKRDLRSTQFASATDQIKARQEISLKKIGAYLQSVREEKSLSQRDIHQQTFIQVHMLDAIEKGNLKSLPEPFYVRAFLRKYALTLGISDLEFVQEFPLG